MAETKKKQTYSFGATKVDPTIYLENLRSNALGYLKSRTDWTPEQKQEWQNSYNAYIKAFQEDADNGGGRFSTDDFGNIIDKKGEFSDIDNDLFYYTANGRLISEDLYNLLKDSKKRNYKPFESNKWFATYANQVGNALVKAMKEKQGTENNDSFDYAKNGFGAYWQKKYNPAGDSNDPSIYWKQDKDGQYTNRVNTTIADLDDYIANSDLPDNVKSAMQNYRDTLATYSTDKKFDLENWKNRVSLAATKAGVSTWNNGYFNFGNNGSAETSLSTNFDINNDEDLLNRYPELKDLIAAHPELRDIIIANKRDEYNKESLTIRDTYNKSRADNAWNDYLTKNPWVGDVRKRNYSNRIFLVNGYYSGTAGRYNKQDRSYDSLNSVMNALANRGDSDDYFLSKVISPISNVQFNNLGSGLAYYLPFILKTPLLKSLFDKYIETTKDIAGNTVYKVKNSKNKAGEYLYFISPLGSGKVKYYRSKSYNDLYNSVIAKAASGFKFITPALLDAINKKKLQQAALANPATPEELKRKIYGKLQVGANLLHDDVTTARAISAVADIGSMLAAFVPGYGTVGSAVTGLGATGANLYADINDKSVSGWQAAGNAALGLGMDVMGLIPGLGMGAKAGKVAKTVSKIAPVVLGALGAANALDAESRKSWGKLDTPSKLTVLDWRNIANGISFAAGLRRGIKGYRLTKAILLATKTGNFKITTKSGKELSLTPNQVELLNNAKSVEEANGLLGKWFKGEEVLTKDSSWWLKFRHPMNESKRSLKPFIGTSTEYGDINYNKLKGISKRDIKWLTSMANFGEKAELPNMGLFKNPYVNYDYVEPRTFSHVPYINSKVMFPLVSTNKVYTISNTPKNVLRDYAASRGVYLGDIPTPPRNSLFESRRAMPFYKGSYKKGGIIKAQLGSKLWYSGFSKYDKSNDVAELNTDKLYSGDMSDNKLRDPIVSNLNGVGVGRYKPAEGNTKELALKIEALPYYKSFENLILNQDGTFTDVGLKWAHAVDAYLPKGSKASFFKDDGTLNTEWTLTNNDAYNRGPETYKTLRDYVKKVRFDEINGARHNIFINLGKHYYYLDNLGLKVYVNPKEIKDYTVSDTPTESNFDSNTGTLWDEYLITAPASKTGTMGETLQTTDDNSLDLLKNAKGINPLDTYGTLRAMTADATNTAIANIVKLKPYLLDPLQDFRNVYSDLDAEINGQRAAAQYNLSVSLPLTSNGNLQTMALLDATIKGLDAITLGRLQSNLYLRQMSELAWLLNLANHTNRHNTAMQNRLMLWQTDLVNRNIDASLLNLKYTSWDALALEKEFEAKQDRELRKALLEKFAENRINDRVKYLLRDYVDKYGLTSDDVDLWDSVYLNGTTSLQDILKDPAKYLQWSRILNSVALIKSDLTANWYSIPTGGLSNRQLPFTIQIKYGSRGYKSGGTINKKKVREAASGDKLAVALLKAATADADRFNKSVNAFIDRSYDAISRLMDYSTKKKKTKKKSK